MRTPTPSSVTTRVTPVAPARTPALPAEPLDERDRVVAELFAEYHGPLIRLATLLGAHADAEDVVSEAFYRVYRKWKRIRDPHTALPYLRATVCNLVRTRARHAAVVRRHNQPPVDEVTSADIEVELREDQREVVKALTTLPMRQRQALVLRYWLDLTQTEVAEAMGISCGAVKTHISRGMASIQRQLGGSR